MRKHLQISILAVFAGLIALAILGCESGGEEQTTRQIEVRQEATAIVTTASVAPTVPPRDDPLPRGTQIGSWTVLRGEHEDGEWVGIATQSISGDKGALSVTCNPEVGNLLFVHFDWPISSQTGMYDVRVSGGSGFEYDLWTLTSEATLLGSSDPLETIELLRGSTEFRIQVDRKHEISLNPLTSSQDSGPPLASAAFDTSGAPQALRQVVPCVRGEHALPATPTSTSEPLAQSTETPSPILETSPTATPAPSGQWFGEWKLRRTAFVSGQKFVALTLDGSSDEAFSTLTIGCAEEIGLYFWVDFHGFQTLMPGDGHKVRTYPAGDIVATDWHVSSDGSALISTNPQQLIDKLRESTLFEVFITLDYGPQHWVPFNISGMDEAVKQVYPCSAEKAVADGGIAPGLDRTSPIPFGKSIKVKSASDDSWDIMVVHVDANAGTAGIGSLGSGYKNDPPAESQFFLARIQVTNTGDESSDFNTRRRLATIGSEERRYDAFFDRCGRLEDEFVHNKVLETGETLEGDVCWEIATSDADSLVMIVSVGEGYFFSLQPET